MKYVALFGVSIGTISLFAQLGLWFPGLNWIVGLLSVGLCGGGVVVFATDEFSHLRLATVAILAVWLLGLMLGYQIPWGWR